MSQPIGPENDGRDEFPGFVRRQSLIDFCRQRVAEIGQQQTELESVLDFSKFNSAQPPQLKPDEAILHEAYSANIGEQRAYRAICEWAGSHNTPPTEMDVRQPDTDIPVQTTSEASLKYEVVGHKKLDNFDAMVQDRKA